MQVGTHSERWENLKQPAERLVEIEEKRKARLEKTKVRQLDYYDTKTINTADFHSTKNSDAAKRLTQDLD